jgi:hypothetical protein
MKILIPIGLIIFIFSLSGCYYDSKEFLYPQLNKCDTANITYTFCVTPIIENNCLGCHSGSASSGGNIKLDSYTEVKKQVDNGKLLGSIKWSGVYSPMPKNSAKLSTDDITIIEKWINKGALDN